jgi:hypothetical protein
MLQRLETNSSHFKFFIIVLLNLELMNYVDCPSKTTVVQLIAP